MASLKGDVRDPDTLEKVFQEQRPEVVFHMAAQSLVRESYRRPVETFATNVIGTVHCLEATRRAPCVRAVVIVTTDKCYRNRGAREGYRETDELGGDDPYSASKAAAELATHAYRRSFFGDAAAALVASARAGNVIGGGDWAAERLVPDAMRSFAAAQPLGIRNPAATRPWQHVLEPLSAYLLLGQKLLEGCCECEGGWNFGPGPDDNCTVVEVLKRMRVFWPGLAWQVTQQTQPHEAQLLYLDSNKARKKLGWRPVWPLETTLRATADWYRHYHEDGRAKSRSQLKQYVADAREAGLSWGPA